MSASICRPALLALALGAALGSHAADFRYEGRLDDFGRPANGRYDIELSVFGGATAGKALSSALTFPGVEVRDGRFQLDFDAPLTDAKDAWVQVAVRAAGDATYSSIPGRSKAIAAPLIGACWSTTGDSGSNAATNFLGTTDAQPLVLRTRNAQSLRIEPSTILDGTLPITANVVAGGSWNSVAVGIRGATIAGGGFAGIAEFPWLDPDLTADAAPNYASGHYATISGGVANQVIGLAATVTGGVGNWAGGEKSAILGGMNNRAEGIESTVAGGSFNEAAGNRSFVSGGSSNCAGGYASWAGGEGAKVLPSAAAGGSCSGLPAAPPWGHEGTFVWADRQGSPFVSTGVNQFLVRAGGGMAINTNTPAAGNALTVAGSATIQSPGTLSFGSATRQMLNLFGTSFGSGVQLNTHYFRSGTGFAWFAGGTHNDNENNPGGGSVLMTLTPNAISPAVAYSGRARAQNFEVVSDRAVKTDFSTIDSGVVLDQVVQLPISSWRYIDAPGERHIGPVAQDFRALFGLGSSERTISTVDTAGVALAAIQGLNAKLEAENAALRDELAALRALIEARLPAEH
jgi:hypothetical protein